jgi:hypothetical protein
MTNKMTQAAAQRIQSATAKANGGIVPAGSFSTRAQATASRSAPSTKAPVPNGPSRTGNPSGGGRGNNPAKK